MNKRAPVVAEYAITIAAPIDAVWTIMTDVDRYGEWNPFIVEIDPGPGGLRVGSRVRLDVRWAGGGGARSVEAVTRLDAPAAAGDGLRRAAMEYRFTGWLSSLWMVRGARLQALEERPDGQTIYHTTEEFRGLLARAVPLANVRQGFAIHAKALKARAEAGESRSSGLVGRFVRRS